VKTEKEVLLTLRGSIAHSKQCQPFYVFRDVELDLLLKKRPTTLEALASIKGFPKEGSRVTKWGKAIIQVFIDHTQIQEFKVVGKKGEDPVVSVTLKESRAFG
jgi:ribonuclease D